MTPGAADFDVVIIGGGPGGSTTGSLLRKYGPDLRVLILEREIFPRDHIGESHLPPISAVLDEMGCWDKVEAANFPIKVGGTYRWGKSPELWHFEFLPLADFKDEPRPGKYEGFRQQTAFQVDRSIYDKILLDHAAELGCVVRQGTRVAEILRDGDRVDGLRLGDGSVVTARYYIDASGNAAILRKAMGVAIDCPTSLKNIALWDYWENAEWAAHIGVGGTRIQIMSLGYGWLWFIPIGPTRTSLGFVCPAEYYKQSGQTAEALYAQAVAADERISALVAKGTRRGVVETTNDWSFLAERTVGENWFLVGETAGFADPILSAGMTLTQTGARELAFTLLELLGPGGHDPAWLKLNYDQNQRARVRQHIRFADYWYACNGQFTDLQAHCAEIAREAGLDLSPQKAWAWLAQGGFANDVVGQAGIGGCSLTVVKSLGSFMGPGAIDWQISGKNRFTLKLEGAAKETLAVYEAGRVAAVQCLARGGRKLPITGFYDLWVQLLQREARIEAVLPALQAWLTREILPEHRRRALGDAFEALEVMVSEGWVEAALDPERNRLELGGTRGGRIMHWDDAAPAPGRD
jgi:flavin-dependent dehydrogenase